MNPRSRTVPAHTLVALAVTVLLVAAALTFSHQARSASPNTNCGANCEGGGPSCTWSGTVPAHTSRAPCPLGVWRYADLATTGCCTGGSSFTYFWYGYSDIRWSNVNNLRIYAANPASAEQFVLTNNSANPIWYWIHQQ